MNCRVITKFNLYEQQINNSLKIHLIKYFKTHDNSQKYIFRENLVKEFYVVFHMHILENYVHYIKFRHFITRSHC